MIGTPDFEANAIVNELLPELTPERKALVRDRIERAMQEWGDLTAGVAAQDYGERS